MQRPAHTLPCVVQLGFAGSRRLFDNPPTDPARLKSLHEQVEQYLTNRLSQLPQELALGAHNFLVGISQIACGADTLFARACRTRGIPQRIFLPQHRELYLSAVGSDDTPDFTPDEREEVGKLLASDHIIQEFVVSASPDRSEQFADVNVEILRVSDVVICVLREGAVSKPGGTGQLLDRAKRTGKPVLEIRVRLESGQPAFREAWHNKEPFRPPVLPEELASLPVAVASDRLPTRDEYSEPLKKLVSGQANWHQRLFKYAVAVILATHILATLCATIGLAVHDKVKGEHPLWPFVPLLVAELVLLGIGFGLHQYLHHSRAARVWAVARVTAELARSLKAIGNRHVYLEHLFRLQLPVRFRTLLRTLSVLHLRSTWPHRKDPWEGPRDQYLQQRFDDATNGQIGFYQRALEVDERRLHRCRLTFTFCSLLAILATGFEFVLLLAPPAWIGDPGLGSLVLGSLAIVLPVLAVGGLSWAAALDCEARVETFRDTLEFLHRQRTFIAHAASAPEFERLVLETETALLGETAGWYSRRSTREGA